MKLWWLSDYRRLADEKASIERLVADEPWFALERWTVAEVRLAVDGVITVDGVGYPVRLMFPDQYPLVPAWVAPRTPERWSDHQYGSGTLCLELRPDNWTASWCGADLLRSAYTLLKTEKPKREGEGGAVTSAHAVGEVQSYDWGRNPALIGAGCYARLKANAAADVRALSFLAFTDVWPIVIHDDIDRKSPRHPPPPDVAAWRLELPVYLSPQQAPAANQDRLTLLRAAGIGDGEKAPTIGLVIFMGGGDLVVYQLRSEDPPEERRIFVLPDQDGDRSGRQGSAKRIAIVGTGSVGSKLAESVVRAGVTRMTIIDGDVMLPANLERHALDWRDVGFRKAQGLRRLLLNIAPGADIEVIENNLNWQRSARTHAWQVDSLVECDVIVDATGDPATSLFLGAIAAANVKPFVSVEVYEGGIGALVASCLPERDPPYERARASFLAWCDAQGAAPPTPGTGRYDAIADDGAVVVADDAAASVAAAHGARVVLDIVDGKPADANAAWLLIGLTKAWVFDGHGHTIRLDVGAAVGADRETEDADAQEFALALAKEYLDARRDRA